MEETNCMVKNHTRYLFMYSRAKQMFWFREWLEAVVKTSELYLRTR